MGLRHQILDFLYCYIFILLLSDYGYTLLLPSWSKEVCNFFFLISQLRTFGVSESLCDFRETRYFKETEL